MKFNCETKEKFLRINYIKLVGKYFEGGNCRAEVNNEKVYYDLKAIHKALAEVWDETEDEK